MMVPPKMPERQAAAPVFLVLPHLWAVVHENSTTYSRHQTYARIRLQKWAITKHFFLE